MNIDVFTSPMGVLGLFLLSLIGFHGLLLIPRSVDREMFWKSVDYIWLSMSIAALLGLTFSSRELVASQQRLWKERQFASANNILVKQIEYFHNEWCKPDHSAAYCNWITEISRTVTDELDKQFQADKHYPVSLPSDERDRIPNITETMITQVKFPEPDWRMSLFDKDYVIGYLTQFIRGHQYAREELVSLLSIGRGSQRLWLALAVPLIAVALALRMTKVTVELLKASQSGRKPDDACAPAGRGQPALKPRSAVTPSGQRESPFT
jgi:hypothetical protein